MTDEPYENTLSLDELRHSVRQCWNEKHSFEKALRDLPEVPAVLALRFLSGAAMNIHQPDMMALGKALQRTHGLDAVPPKTELECGAGLWSVIRAGMIAARTANG